MSLRKRLLLIFSSLAIFSLIIYVSRNFIRKIFVQPLFVVATYLYDLYSALPQQLVWAVLIFVLFFIALQAIAKGTPQDMGSKEPSRHYPSRVEIWEEWLNLANLGDLYHLKVARELGFLVLSTTANREGIGFSEARRKIQNGGILLPEETKHLLTKSPIGGERNPLKRFFQRFSRKNDYHTILEDFEITIRYLESEMEVQSGNI